LLNQTVK